MKEKVLLFLKNNIISFVYFALAIFMEPFTLKMVGFQPFITNPVYSILIMILVLTILCYIPVRFKAIFSTLFLVVEAVIVVSCIYLYDSNGTFFEWAMFNQRKDAFGTIEELSLRWNLVGIFSVLILLYIGFICLMWFKYYKKKSSLKIKPSKIKKVVFTCLVSVCTIAFVSLPTLSAYVHRNDNYIERYLYGSKDNKYVQKGITANLFYEFFNGTMTNAFVKHNIKGNEVEDFVYNTEGNQLQTSEYFGISKGNNLVYILVESFEWYPFLYNCTPEQSMQLYPNLNRFFKESVYADSFYAREKTDTAEMLALIGSNPTEKYINYDFPTNAYPHSLPNLFKQSVLHNGNQIKHVRSFHQNTGEFYNRKVLHKSLGFDRLVDVEEMADYGIINHWDEEEFEGERTPDSETIEKMQDEMFPLTNANEQYMTFWLTFVMHGYYKEREIFHELGYYDELDAVGAYPASKTDKHANYLRTYAAAVMDFDRAVGMIYDKLEKNNQLDNTTIVMFADHNTYYNNLSKYAKNISNRYNSELYRVPFMIRDTKLRAAYEANEGTNVISKFTTTADMLPTILDMFGIPGYCNLYFGTSMLVKDVESIIFSRAYGIFITDKLSCYSANNLLYESEDFTQEDYESFTARAKIYLTKLQYLDLIYYNNYFKSHDYISLEN